MKRLIAAAVVLGLAGCGSSSSKPKAGDAPPAAEKTARTVALESQLSTRRPGTELTFTGQLFKPDAKEASGRSLGSCTRTAPGGGAVYNCLLTFVLDDGVVYGQAYASADGPSDGAVTGGTGEYRGYVGTFAFKATGSARVKLTLTLSR